MHFVTHGKWDSARNVLSSKYTHDSLVEFVIVACRNDINLFTTHNCNCDRRRMSVMQHFNVQCDIMRKCIFAIRMQLIWLRSSVIIVIYFRCGWQFNEHQWITNLRLPTLWLSLWIFTNLRRFKTFSSALFLFNAFYWHCWRFVEMKP